ncbi:hypothetical protein [Nocardioides rubriscoriae]|uniref:hypothetical protein n=1 Tax=Nocardioides rubriscoriae TaxID=642762 RepID=UPI0011E0433A|nr:hypothetical protein [Nocardioides rubriscoriae]
MRRDLFWAAVVVVVITLLGSASYAAGTVIITSSKQVKDGSLRAADLSAAARASLRGRTGAAGPQGEVGPQGPVGPSAAYAAQRTSVLAMPASAPGFDVVTVAVPAGSYVVSARLQGRTGTDPDPGNNYRFDCALLVGEVVADDPTYRVGVEPSVERYRTYQGIGTLEAPGSITLQCSAGNGHDLEALSAQLTATRVASLG